MFNSHGNILSFVFYANFFYFAQTNRYLAILFFFSIFKFPGEYAMLCFHVDC